MFENIKAAVNAYYGKTMQEFENDMKQNMSTGYALDHWFYRDRMTKKALETAKQLDRESVLPDTIKASMIKRFARENEKKRLAKLEKIALVEQYSTPKNADISVEWKKSKMWGYNPTAEIRADKRTTTGTTSGYGYDKESAAIASAMNSNPEIMRILYEHAETGNTFPYSVNLSAGVPYFDGGCGVSCFKSVFDACGYKWRCVGSGRLYNCYTIEKI